MFRKTALLATALPIALALLLTACAGTTPTAGPTDGVTPGTTPTGAPEPKAVTMKLIRLDNPDTASENDLVREEIRKKFLADTNIDLTFDIEITPWDTSHEMYISKFSAGDRMDAILTHSGIIDTIYQADEEALRPLDDLLAQYAPNYFAFIPEEGWKANMRKGKIVGMPYERLRALYILAGRTDILVDQWGLDVNPETLEELEKLFADIKAQDPQSIPMTGAYWAVMRMVMAYADVPENYTWGPPISFFVDDDDTVKPLIFHENYPAMAEMLAKWVTNGWVPKEVISMNNVQSDQLFHSGKAYISANYYSIPLSVDLDVFRQSEPDARVEMIGIPKAINGVQQLHAEDFANIQWCLPNTGEEESQATFLKYVEWIVSDPANYHLVNYGINGRYYEIQEGLMKTIYRDENGDIATDPDEIERIKAKNVEENFLPYRSLFSVFQTERTGYKLYSDITPKTIIDTEAILQSIDTTEFKLEGKVVFDLTAISAQKTDAENAVTTLLAEILSGVKPVSELEAVKQLYLDNGGQAVIDELTAQYKASK